MSPLWQSIKVRSNCMFTHRTLQLNINTAGEIIFNLAIQPVGCLVDREVTWLSHFFSATGISTMTWNKSFKFSKELLHRTTFHILLHITSYSLLQTFSRAHEPQAVDTETLVEFKTSECRSNFLSLFLIHKMNDDGSLHQQTTLATFI